MKTQPSHRLLCPPHPRPRLRLPSPSRARPAARSRGPRPEVRACGRADRGIPRSRWAGPAPGGSLSLPGQNGDTGLGHGLPLGPRKYLECLGGSLRFPRGRGGKRPHVCQRAPCPAAAPALSAAFPRNALPTQTHTHTPIPCAAASRGGVGEKVAASFRAGSRTPEKRFPPTGDSHRAGSPVAVEADGCRKEGGALPRDKRDGLRRSQSGPGEENRNWI